MKNTAHSARQFAFCCVTTVLTALLAVLSFLNPEKLPFSPLLVRMLLLPALLLATAGVNFCCLKTGVRALFAGKPERHTAATTFTFYVNGAKLTRDGYTFLGWADTADATTASYKGGDPIVLDKDNPTKTIFAVWEKNVAPIEYTVTYYKNDGSANDLFYKTDDWGRPSEQFNIYWGKPTRDGYDFVGWAETRDAKEAKYANGGAGGKQSWIKLDGPKVLYAVWQEAGLEPEAPRSPSDCKDQLKKNTIKLVCVGGNHPDKVITFADVSYGSDWSMGDTCRLNFYAKDAALKYSGHAPKNPEERIYVTFKWVNDKTDANGKYLPGEWVMVETTAAVVELVDTGVEAPSQPTTAQLGNIKVTCRTNAEHSSEFPVAKCMGTTVGTVTFDSVKKQWYIDTAPMTTQLASRYDSWKGYAEGTHRLVNPDAKLNARFYYDGEKWYTEDTLAIDVCCGETPVKPTALDGSFAIVCKNNKATHPYKADYIATPSQYTISDVQMDNQGYYVTATVTVAPNLVAYNTATRAEHRLVNEQDATLTITFRYDPKATGAGNRKWKQQGDLPVVEVICKEIEAPTADELKKLDMAVQVKCVVDAAQQHTSAYGLLGEYDKDYFVGEPKKVGDDWLCDISYDPDPYVAEFNKAFPTPKHIQNDEKIVPVTLIWVGGSWQIKTQGRVHVTEVYTVTYTDGVENEEVFADQVYSDLRKDSATPAFNGTPTRTGYTFAGWEPEVAATVTQTVTYVAKWTPVKPEAPSADELKKLEMAVLVKCVVDDSQQHTEAYGLLGECDEDYFVGEPRKDGDDWLCDISYYPERYVAAFNTTFQNLKHVQDDEKIVPVTLIWAGDSWQIKTQGRVLVTEVYTVTFDSYGGTPVPPAQEVEYGLTATKPAAPEKTGYTFDGWYLGDEKYDFSAAVEQNITLTAKWTQNTYTVTFDPNGGNELAEADKTKAVKIGEAYGELPTPTRKGYNFAGWYTEAEEGTVVTADTTVSAMTDHTLYAHWEAKKANVHIMIFKSNDLGTPIVDRAYTTDAVYGDTLDLAEIDPSSYLDFDFEIDGGWYDDGLFNLYKKYVSGEQANKPAALTKLQITGNWQNLKLIVTELVPVVYFKSAEALAEYQNDHSKVENIIFTTKARVGSTLPTADAPTATRDGYTFTFWSREGQIGTDVTGQTVNGWTNLVANWEARTDTPYTVEHYLENLDGNYALDTTEHLKGTTDTTVTAAAKSYDNFTYDSTVPDTVASGNIAGDGSLVLKLFYTRNTYDYTVRHIKQLPDGSYDEANAEVETLSGKFEALAAVTAKDYGSHYPTNDADTKQNIKIEKGLTIDVKYDLDEHTLTFETNGGSAINPVTVRHGNAVARPADPTKDKYTFIGWYADPEFTEEYDFATVLEADKTIYAKFELTSTPIGDIYVRYDVLHIKQLPDGTYDLANAEVEHLSAKKDTTVTAVIKDYRATHHVNVNRTLSKLTGTAIQPYMGVDGKPVYTILSVYYDLDFHTLTFDTMGGSKIAPETVRHGLTVAKPKDPVNGGYIFDGWYTDKTYRIPYNFATPLTQDTTIYAKWFLIVLPGVTVKKAAPKLNTADHFAYVQGYPDGTVKPAGNITRAETAAILFRLMDDASRKTYYSTKSGFRDVASGSWYNTYVATLNNAGVITDSSNGYFRPNEAITRAELAAMLAKFSETTGAANYFNDVSAKYWAANAIAICAKLGWITGYPDGTFRPDKNVTRAELMAMINRATGRAPKSADAFLPGMKTWIDNTSDKWYYLDVQEATNSHSYTVKGSETWTALTSDPNWSLYE